MLRFCTVCQEEDNDLVEPVLTSCNDTYCWPCIYEAVRKSGDFKCPACTLTIVRVYPQLGGLARTPDLDPTIPARPDSDDKFPFLSLLDNSATSMDQTSLRRSTRAVVPRTFFDDLPELPYTQRQQSAESVELAESVVTPESVMDETDFVRSRRRAVFEPPPARPQSNASADDDISSLSPYGRHVIMRGRRAGGRLSGSLVPGTRKTYHELLVYGIRDYIIEKQIPYPKLKWASVVNFIKEDFPQAWQGKIASQVGKRMKGNMTRIMKKRTEKKKFVKGSGISGPRLTSLEKAVDEISVFRIHSHEPEVEEPTPGTSNGEYMNNRNPTRNLTSGEKKRLGQSIRDAATSNMDPSRARDIRLDSTLNQTLSGFRMDVERTLGGHGEGTNSMLNNVEHLRQRQEEDRVKDQERSAQANMMNNNMQMVQMAMMTHFVQTLTGQAPHGVPLQVGPLEVGTVQAGAGPGRSISKKTVDLYYTIDEQDSDEFPLRCELENFEDLK